MDILGQLDAGWALTLGCSLLFGTIVLVLLWLRPNSESAKMPTITKDENKRKSKFALFSLKAEFLKQWHFNIFIARNYYCALPCACIEFGYLRLSTKENLFYFLFFLPFLFLAQVDVCNFRFVELEKKTIEYSPVHRSCLFYTIIRMRHWVTERT